MQFELANLCNLDVHGSSTKSLSLYESLHDDLRDLIDLAGFELFILTQTRTLHDHAVVTALAERWRDTFVTS